MNDSLPSSPPPSPLDSIYRLANLFSIPRLFVHLFSSLSLHLPPLMLAPFPLPLLLFPSPPLSSLLPSPSLSSHSIETPPSRFRILPLLSSLQFSFPRLSLASRLSLSLGDFNPPLSTRRVSIMSYYPPFDFSLPPPPPLPTADERREQQTTQLVDLFASLTSSMTSSSLSDGTSSHSSTSTSPVPTTTAAAAAIAAAPRLAYCASCLNPFLPSTQHHLLPPGVNNNQYPFDYGGSISCPFQDCGHFLCANCTMAHQYMHCFEGHRVEVRYSFS